MQKTNFKTRLLALLTAAFMLVMCVPFAAFAEESKAKSITVSWADFKTNTMPNSVTVTENGAKAKVPHLEDGLSWYHGDVELVPDTEFGYEDVAAVANGDEFISFDAKEKKAEEKPEVKKEVTVNINLSDPEAGYFTDNKEAKTLTYEHLAADGKIEGLKNMVTANEGYEFTGWTWDGKGSGTLDVGATEFMYTDSAFYNGDATTGYVTLTAQFKKVEQPETQKHHFTVNFTVAPDKGSFTDYGAGPVVFQGYEEEVGGQQYNVPAVTAKEGYKFVGWKGQGASEIAWGADAKTFGISGLCFYQDGSYEGNASIEAQFEEVKTEQPEETKKTVSVTITTNNEQGIFPDYDGQEVIHFDNLDPNTDQQFELPKVEAKPGYEFIGWHVNGNEVGAWDADAKTFGITGLAHFEKGSNVGYLTIAAVYKAETERTVEVTFSVDPDKGEFEKNDLYTSPAANVMKLTATEFDGTQYAIPTVKAKAGYKFVGWKGQGADVIAWNADAKTFGVTGLCFFNGDDATTGYATVEAVFEKVEDKKNDNSSSSSSASSSSNKTTTASNEKQVVKAAAAPANTTKVLPKTGASNVAPLLGGSLAVVALLMGYGVYSLVLRKKD
ncbi:MAG: InlB B-repeat-containing protein [Gemmiger sp.]|uniref:InlB B-repeat-containing protein n=1 Tax=Gemmiger sp. TaxID=2049027 RepID=UPI00300F00D0